MKVRMLLFFGTAVLVLALACLYMARRSMAMSPTLQRHPGVVWGVAFVFLLVQFGVPVAARLFGFRLAALHGISYLTLSLVATFFLYLAIADFAQLLGRVLCGATGKTWALHAALGATLLSTGLGLVQCYLPIRIRRLEVPIQGLPADLDGFRLAQISDLHLGPLLPTSRVASIVARINGLSPDLVAVTGDLADGAVEQERDCLAELGRLGARHGVRFVTGNHEYYSGVGPWLEAIQGLGWKPLLNEHEILRHQGAELVVIGLPDPAGAVPNLGQALAGAPEAATKVLLFHQPLGSASAARAGIHLQLSGHTHGGQFFPWSPIVRLFFDHPLGLHRIDRMWLYTSPGTGFWGPPNRFLVPPEITLLTLKRA